ncbi:Peptidase family M50 [Popillia japonica]|uniref:Peptidase family M50 n=1 Tax=Popillia japonica TaxID=7064 RepID=A0AAW1K2F3_POPJA
MDIFALLFLSAVSILFAPKKINEEAYTLPEALKKEIENDEISFNSSTSISLMLQFLFHELRHSQPIKRWLYKKLTLEFDELLTKTTIGKFFEAVKIRDMNLGTQFPHIKNICLEDIKLDKVDGHIDTLNISVNLDYTGNFLLSVDAKMKFGKTAYLSIKVKKINGSARLQFTRVPYTHWSFSFYNEPLMELAVESHFQGRQLQSNITNLIVNQIKKAIKRKHTLPNYKIRYKPFFVKTDPGQLDSEDNEILPQGQLEVTCIEVSRLSASNDIVNIYCTLTIDQLPFISIYNRDGIVYLMLEVTLIKVRQQHLGVVFKQEQTCVTVDNVISQTPAAKAGLKSGDMILAVENKNITSVTQVSKIIKSISGVNITLRIERAASDYLFKSKQSEKTDLKTPTTNTISIEDSELNNDEPDTAGDIVGDSLESSRKFKSLTNIEKIKNDKVPKIISASNENMSKFAQTIGSFSLRKRKQSVERTSNESSTRSTPTASSPGTPQHGFKQHLIVMPSNMAKKHSISEVPEIVRTDLESHDVEVLTSVTECHRGKEVAVGSIITFNDEFVFNLKECYKYLNVNVWGISPSGKDMLLGYTNIPITEILNECCNSLLGHYIRTYSFLPPNNTPPNNQTHPLMSHSGFEHVFCYGDILLSFVWNHDEEVIEVKRKIPTNDIHTDSKLIPTVVKHDFVRTQFHRTTHCDFCTKKIWLKDAVQCRQCGLCCHKKCISKCQIGTECVPMETAHLKSENVEVVQPDMNINEAVDDINESDNNLDTKQYFSLKRVNSANNLTIPGFYVSTCQSRSLPPSPQHTPSRKQSIVDTNPFILCPTALDEVQKNSNEVPDCIARLLEHIMVCPSDESLMDTAKESGKILYANMPTDEKVEKINIMMTELKKIFDTVTTDHADLSKKLNAEESEVEKAKLAFLMGKADAKMHAISALMLHYCSGLQQTQEKII